MLRQGEREEGAVDAGGGRQAAGLHLHPWHRQLDQRAPESRSSSFLLGLLLMWRLGAKPRCVHGCRAEEVRQELQAEVHQLPAPQPQARELHPGGGGPHRHPPRHAREQVQYIAAIGLVFLFLLSFALFVKVVL